MSTPHFSEQDNTYMSLAIELAKKGRFTTAPNPNVGCVIVNDSVIVGEGFHYKAGEPHAEIHALAMAKNKSHGATCYVTLEPCSHYGRTPPCAVALVKAGVKRVVIAMGDPNPKVSGRGVKVDVGLLEAEANALNLGFIKRMKTKTARVTVKMASSLDGKTALSNGQSQWITGEQARIDVQYYRAQQSAVLTGSGTVLEDNPSLNVRFSELSQSSFFDAEVNEDQLRQPIRIILDSSNKLTLKEKLFGLSGKTIIVSLFPRDDFNLLDSNAEVEQLVIKDDGAGKIDLQALLIALNSYEINDLWVEAGATLAGEWFNQSLVDEFILYQAPKLMGDQSRNLVNLPNYSKMDNVVQLTLKELTIVGNDIRIISNRD